MVCDAQTKPASQLISALYSNYINLSSITISTSSKVTVSLLIEFKTKNSLW